MLADARAGLADAREKFEQASRSSRSGWTSCRLPPICRARRRNVPRPPRREPTPRPICKRRIPARRDRLLCGSELRRQEPERIAALQKAGEAFDDSFSGIAPRRLPKKSPTAPDWPSVARKTVGSWATSHWRWTSTTRCWWCAGPRRQRGGNRPRAALRPGRVFPLLILAKQKPREFLAEAKTWLDQHRVSGRRRLQGIALELAKAKLVPDDKATARKNQAGLRGPANTDRHVEDSQPVSARSDSAASRRDEGTRTVGVRRQNVRGAVALGDAP